MDDSRARVLFITGGSIGDAALTSGLLSRFVETEPEAYFTVAAGPAAATLFAETPRLERLIAIRKRRSALHWFDLWRQVRGRRWKTIVDMRGSGLAYLLRAERRFVFRPLRQPAGSPPLHKALEAARTIGRLDDPPALRLYTSAATEARADALLGRDRPILAIAPTATWPPKTWPPERFAKAAPAPQNPTPLQAMRHRLQTPAGRRLYALRKQIPEPVFGIIKSVMGFRQFLLRGLDRVQGEWGLVTMAWNMRRMYALTAA